eukprot:gene10972-12799_t
MVGGAGGYPNGANGGSGGVGVCPAAFIAPTGGTASAGGTVASSQSCFNTGTFGVGGACCGGHAGGGGGGYWGGGSSFGASGGGGSSYVASGVGLVSHGTIATAGHGSPSIEPSVSPTFSPSAQVLVESFTAVGTAYFVVPVGVASITVILYGGSGGDSICTDTTVYGGWGGIIRARIPVTSGETLQINLEVVGEPTVFVRVEEVLGATHTEEVVN